MNTIRVGMDEVMGPPGPGKLSLLLNAEISAVITAMRANAKWAVVPNKYNVRTNVCCPAYGACMGRWMAANADVCGVE